MIVTAVTLALTLSTGADYVKEVEAWRERRLERLRREDSWLTLVGLHWLQPGDNPVGSDPSNRVLLPPGRAPARVGSLVLADGRVRLTPAPGADVRVGGKPAGDRVLKSDADGEPDVIEVGDLRFHVIKRGDRIGVRVKDPKSPVRLGFKGIETYPIAESYRVVGDWVPYDAPRDVEIPTVLGTVEPMRATGYARFEVNGATCTLEPVIEDPGDPQLFFIFKDGTSGKETYGAGRFLYASPAEDGKVVLDFNKAYNPPCVFTPYATCPLPPKRNWLPVRVEAGEKTFGHH